MGQFELHIMKHHVIHQSSILMKQHVDHQLFVLMKQHVELQPQLLLHILFQLNLNNFFPTSYVVTNPTHSHKNKRQKMKQGTQKKNINIKMKK
jgi:hypothetical protein